MRHDLTVMGFCWTVVTVDTMILQLVNVKNFIGVSHTFTNNTAGLFTNITIW